jgi:hypothetical protein
MGEAHSRSIEVVLREWFDRLTTNGGLKVRRPWFDKLMELLAIRLSCQSTAAKSLVITTNGGLIQRFLLAKTQCVQQYPVIEYFRARQIGNCDVDVMIAITSVMALCVSG